MCSTHCFIEFINFNVEKPPILRCSSEKGNKLKHEKQNNKNFHYDFLCIFFVKQFMEPGKSILLKQFTQLISTPSLRDKYSRSQCKNSVKKNQIKHCVIVKLVENFSHECKQILEFILSIKIQLINSQFNHSN